MTGILVCGMALTGCQAGKEAPSAVTTAATEAASAAATETATTAATTASTEATTIAATEAATEATTEAATEATTEAPTEGTSEGATEGGSTAATEAIPDDPNIDKDTGIHISEDNVDTTYGKDAVMQIVVIGDSQFGMFNGYDGLAYRVSQYCHANVYNMAIGGTCAALTQNESRDDDNWDSKSGIGMSRLLGGELKPDFLSDPSYAYQLDVYQHLDPSKTDVFIVEYGVNDFDAKVPLDTSFGQDQGSYRGALNSIMMTLTMHFPNAKIIVCTPTYAQFFQGGAYIGDSNTLDNGYGTLYDYVKAGINAVEGNNSGNVKALTPYYDIDINAGNAAENLIDGIHMNPEYRDKYAQLLSRVIIGQMGYSIPEDTDPSTVEWWTTK